MRTPGGLRRERERRHRDRELAHESGTYDAAMRDVRVARDRLDAARHHRDRPEVLRALHRRIDGSLRAGVLGGGRGLRIVVR